MNRLPLLLICGVVACGSRPILPINTNVCVSVAPTTMDKGWGPTTDIDATGLMHLSYESVDDHLVYSRLGGSSTVLGGEDVSVIGLNLDAQAHPYVASWEWNVDVEGTDEIRVYSNASGSWRTTVIPAGDLTWAKFAVGRHGELHFAGITEEKDALVYLTNASGRWDRSIIETCKPHEIESLIEVALDRDDRVHLVYQDPASKALVYSSNRGGRWVKEVVDSTGKMYSAKLVIDSRNHIHITYEDWRFFDSNLKYATNASGQWVTTTVDAQRDASYHNALAIDAGGNPHIAFYDERQGDLLYATNDNGQWRIEPVDTEGDVGLQPNINVDGSGKIHIVYIARIEKGDELLYNAIKYAGLCR